MSRTGLDHRYNPGLDQLLDYDSVSQYHSNSGLPEMSEYLVWLLA